MTELELKAEEYKNKIEPCDMVYNDIVGMNECRFDLDQFKQAYKDGYEQGQKDKLTEKEKLVGTFINVDLEKENEELKKSVTEKNSKIKELKDLLNRSNLRLAEEQIKNEELIAENKALAEENNILVKGLGCETCSIHLEYENLNNQIAELKAQIKDLCSSLDIMNNRESELLAQIEKMKCCNNCEHFKYDCTNGYYCDLGVIEKWKTYHKKCNKWELAE